MIALPTPLARRFPELQAGIQRFPGRRVLVIGDVMLDVFIWGDVQRISPEAPVPVVDVRRESQLLGGAANVVHNIAALGGRPSVVGLIGEDAAGRELLRQLEDLHIPTTGLVRTPERPTTQKTRIIAHHQQVVRFDREDPHPPSRSLHRHIIDSLAAHFSDAEVVVVSDYGKGLITAELMDTVRALAATHRVPILVDPKVKNADAYRAVDLITPNNAEASAMSGVTIADEASLLQAGAALLDRFDCGKVLITRGPDGMSLFERGAAPFHIPTVARKVFDVTGAGDTVIATMALALAAGLDMRNAAILANVAAGMVVGELGTATVGADQLIEALNDGSRREP
ncbi:D-beta-D-heptose 7-phosphate kinase / D-beta-D-heptose 1-phosphate adenosyltransferase [Desulfacinum hydrothermale DSM 13146]|uniref:D-beta-D-heptose 7-phosphate kinase / D-beta-D-heptose 1-phosphate adenosyltransferase n=2 Tax=Desulfacinum hydrothermale TaxID=109258 RepID=A0A1W1XSE1_9BACT|nr:D-beta-D-heptose 7-phosphate kinase / D-beta-D-heptose 1-phosphate adenosyltransferase [Desulfacinum hydrothermale DSM 13146]